MRWIGNGLRARMVHGSQLGLLYGVLNGRQLPGSLPRLVIVSSSGSNMGNVSGIAGGDVDRDIHPWCHWLEWGWMYGVHHVLWSLGIFLRACWEALWPGAYIWQCCQPIIPEIAPFSEGAMSPHHLKEMEEGSQKTKGQTKKQDDQCNDRPPRARIWVLRV